MNYIIRKMQEEEYPLLENFLYEAIFQRDENNLVPRSIIEKPELQVYIKDFGKKTNDVCFCAEVEGHIVGAVWVRIIDGYGNIDNTTPEFAISLHKEYRGKGIGTELMKKMINHLKETGCGQTSLAVQKDNYAAKLYQKVGFQIIDENEEEYIMLLKFR